MTQPDPESTLSNLIQAAGNADAVRLASLVHNATVNGQVQTFTRQYLVDAWSARWRRHVAAPAGRRPEQRVNRSLPVLIAVTAVAALDGPNLSVDDPDILQFLADRVYLAEALDVQNPLSNTLPVGEATRAAAAALVAASLDVAADGEGVLAVDAEVVDVEPVEDPDTPEGPDTPDGLTAPDTSGAMTLTVSAEVIKGGSPS